MKELFTVSLDENNNIKVEPKEKSLTIGTTSSKGMISFNVSGIDALKKPVKKSTK